MLAEGTEVKYLFCQTATRGHHSDPGTWRKRRRGSHEDAELFGHGVLDWDLLWREHLDGDASCTVRDTEVVALRRVCGGGHRV